MTNRCSDFLMAEITLIKHFKAWPISNGLISWVLHKRKVGGQPLVWYGLWRSAQAQNLSIGMSTTLSGKYASMGSLNSKATNADSILADVIATGKAVFSERYHRAIEGLWCNKVQHQWEIPFWKQFEVSTKLHLEKQYNYVLDAHCMPVKAEIAEMCAYSILMHRPKSSHACRHFRTDLWRGQHKILISKNTGNLCHILL